MKPFQDGDAKLAAETARQLALWMSYEDIVRVADLKTRASRFERVRKEVGAKDGEPVVVIDFLKPAWRSSHRFFRISWGETAVMGGGKRQAGCVQRRMHVKTSGILGYLTVRSLACSSAWRPHSHRYQEEQS